MMGHTRSSLAILTEFFSAAHIEATARRTGFVQRASKITGKTFLALVTFGVWGEAKTTLAQLAAKVRQVGDQVDVSPEAIHQRMNHRALAFLQELIRTAFAKIKACQTVCDERLFASFAKVHIADSTGFELPASLKDAFPGAGGSASQAGAKIQLVWEYKSRTFAHFALMPWNMPDNRYIDTVVTLAQKDALFLFDLGYFKLQAFASIAAANAYFLSRLNHQTQIFAAVAGQLHPVELAGFLKTVKSNLIERPIFLGATERVASRLIAARMPEAIVNERRRVARKNAKKKGYTPSQAHLALLAWNLFITNVPPTLWTPETVIKVYPLRWQVELIFKSWKSSLHLASITTKKADTTLCYLYGRMLLIVLTYALCPQRCATLWWQKKRELSLLKLVRHFQALAEWWMQAIFQSELALRRFLHHACVTAERLAVKASRRRQTTAQILHESLSTQNPSTELAEALSA